MWFWFKSVLLILPFCLLLPGCGYTLNHRLKEAFLNPKGLYVPVMKNDTDETAAELIFTNALIRELASRGEIVMNSSKSGALELRGTINALSYGTTAATETGFRGLQGYQRLPTEVGVSVSITLSLVDPLAETVVWKRDLGGFRRVPAPTARTYDHEAPSSIGPATQSLVESTYSAIAQDIMRDAYDEMVELF